ncbi:MAG: hypothetical protein KDA60_00420 [Planctomycetales bacterium]|nr:hypothetical protein [Planctomycetales bacterium]
MSDELTIGRYSIGVGDRFAHQAAAQLAACLAAQRVGVEIQPVWNKSHREHTTIGSQPASVRTAADEAVRASTWAAPYFVDADHINLSTVDHYLSTSDFFTIDVADAIGATADADLVTQFVQAHPELAGPVAILGISDPVTLTTERLAEIARKYLKAVTQAGAIYRHIAAAKGAGTFVTEVSMDETDTPQKPDELLVILAAIADEQIPIQTIAPKFTGRFNKGVDYVGDVEQFTQEFRDDLAVIAYAVRQFPGLPENLKLSVHSGSDKFSIYGPIQRALAETGAGLHLKTAGTTWLEELIGLAEAGGEGLALAKTVYAQAHEKRDELCAPYAAVIDIDSQYLPTPATVATWSSQNYVQALRHIPACPDFNPHFRQLLHVGYKIAAKQGARYLEMLDVHRDIIAKNVTENLWERHIQPLFVPTS